MLLGKAMGAEQVLGVTLHARGEVDGVQRGLELLEVEVAARWGK